MAEYEDDEDDQLPSVDHGPLNEGSWEKGANAVKQKICRDMFVQIFKVYNPVILTYNIPKLAVRITCLTLGVKL